MSSKINAPTALIPEDTVLQWEELKLKNLFSYQKNKTSKRDLTRTARNVILADII